MESKSAPHSPLLVARDFTLRVATKPLLENANFEVARGEIVLLVGPSGAGKSLLLQLLASVLRPGEGEISATGTLQLHDTDVLAPRDESSPRVGLVFQDHALFDDLTAAENLEFALDHAAIARGENVPTRDEREAKVKALLDEFGLAGLPHIRALSGGQRQRLAVARTLAQDPQLIIYDEPTTGLDPVNARRIAARIDETHRAHGKTSILVTHDFAALVPIVDRVLLLDPRSHSIREIEKGAVESELLACGGALAPPPSPSPNVASAPKEGRVRRFLRRTGDVADSTLFCLSHIVPRWAVPRWGARALLHQLRLVAWPSAIAYMAIAGVILGIVTTYFTFRYLPMKHYTEPLLIDEILSGLGFLLFRVLAPSLATILIAARAGAAVTADLGNRTYSRQFDALRSLGLEPARYHSTAVSLAFLIGTPILCAVTYLVAAYTSEIVFVLVHHPAQSAFFWKIHFFRNFVDPETGAIEGLGWTLAKVETAGLGVGFIAYVQGASPKRAGSDVSNAITRAILWSTLYVLVVHSAFAFIEF